MASPSEDSLDLKTVRNELNEVVHKTYEIGIQLGIPHFKMEMFGRGCDPLSAVIEYWLHSNVSGVPITWKYIVQTLKSDHVQANGVAERIAKKYCCQSPEVKDPAGQVLIKRDSESRNLTPAVREKLEWQLERNYLAIEKKYGLYVDMIRDSLKEKISAEELRTHLLTFSAFRSSQQSALGFQGTDTINKIFQQLIMECCSFLEIDIFQSIVERYNLDQVNDFNYLQDVKEFINLHNIKEFLSINPDLKLHCDDSEILILKFDVASTTSKLSKVMNLKKAVAKILDIKDPSALRLLDIEKGCVVLTFCIPANVAATIDVDIFIRQKKKFEDLLVLWLQFKNRIISFSEKPGPELTQFLKCHQINGEELMKKVLRSHLQEIISEYCKNWRCLQPALGVTRSDFYATSSGENEKRRNFFLEWSRRRGLDASYYKLVNALLKTNNEIDAKFVCTLLKDEPVPVNSSLIAITDDDKKPHASSDPSSQDVNTNLEEQLHMNFDKIQKQYAHYVDCIKTIILDKGISAKRLSSFLLNLPASNSTTLLSDLEVLMAIDNVEDIFIFLASNYASFFDYDVFEKILMQFGANEFHEDLNYPAHLMAYAEMHKIEEFMRLKSPKRAQLDDKSKAVRIKFGFQRTQSLGMLKEVTRAVANILELEPSTLRLCDLEKGSVLATFLVHTSVANAVFTSETTFAEDQICGFQALSLFHLECNGIEFNFIPAVDHSIDPVNAYLRFACNKGHLDIAKLLITKFNAEVCMQDNAGRTPLHCACEKGHFDIVRVLVLEFKADVCIQDYAGRTPLHYACEKGHLSTVTELASNFKTDLVTIKDHAGCTPLHYACRKGHFDVVKVMLLEAKANLGIIQDNNGQTPLHYACKKGHLNVVEVLVEEFGADLIDHAGCSPLHYACANGHLNVVEMLVSKFSANVSVQDHSGSTPLHFACENGHLDVVRTLISVFEAGVNTQDNAGRTPLHCACEKGHLNVVKLLVSEFKANFNTRDHVGGTPLHYACKSENTDVVKSLALEFKADLNVRDDACRTLLHYACEKGHLDVVEVLVSKFKADLSILDTAGHTPLMVAASNGHEDVVLALLRDYQCPVTDTHNDGWGILHYACAGGNAALVKTLVRYFKIDVRHQMVTPLQVAVQYQNFNVAFSLIRDFGCDPNVADKQGQTPLHHACGSGDIDLVRSLVGDHKADVNAYNNAKRTPLEEAMKHSKLDVAFCLINEFGCVLGKKQTLLHLACENGDLNVVHALIRDHKVDTEVHDMQMNTPLHVAAEYGHHEVALALVSEYSCDPNARGHLSRTPLHMASLAGHHKTVQVLLKFISPSVTDRNGDTPLHLASAEGQLLTIKCLLHSNAPVLIKNKRGQTPINVSRNEFRKLLEENPSVKFKPADCIRLYEYANRKYSGSHYITRVFVLGNPGAGKSSFIESLKREGFFQSFNKVSESSVPPHTAGIIPSVHMSKQYGRVLFYDFAGDAEYYSSHAAIFESLASSRKGDNIFIIVVDLREDSITITTTLHYWFSFVQYQKFSRSSFIVVGGHLDQSVEHSECLKEFCTAMQPHVYNIKHFMLDCRDPRSKQIAQVKKQIFTWVSESQKYELSSEAKLLLGLLEQDFRAVTACPVQILFSHIKESGVWLPVEPQPLYKILLELHEVGILLLLGDCTKDSDHIILNISKLTNEVHSLLFSASAIIMRKTRLFNIGILPKEILEELLPPYISTECLISLQYCQKISSNDIPVFPAFLKSAASQYFLFFPALCSADKSQVSWDVSSSNSFSIGWLALCNRPHDYFPPRFLHVLLLRLVYGFSLSPARLQTAHAFPEHSRCCTMWKNGVHWLMEEGVDCMVEMVNGSKGVVVLTKSSMDGAEDCTRIFSKVVSCVMEAKAEFCLSTKPEFFLLDSSAEADYLNQDHQFAMSDVERALDSPQEKSSVISVSGRGKIEASKLRHLRNHSFWYSLFPIDINTVLHVLRDIVRWLYELGLSLGVPRHVLEAIETDFPNDVSRRRTELVRWWMNFSQDPPCWWHLVQALRRIDEDTLAERIRKDHGLHILLQEKLLCKETQSLKPDEEFLHSLSGVVESRWPSLAVPLAMSEKEITRLKGKVGLSQQELALQMLKIWASQKEATYGQLCRKLKTISLFQY